MFCQFYEDNKVFYRKTGYNKVTLVATASLSVYSGRLVKIPN